MANPPARRSARPGGIGPSGPPPPTGSGPEPPGTTRPPTDRGTRGVARWTAWALPGASRPARPLPGRPPPTRARPARGPPGRRTPTASLLPARPAPRRRTSSRSGGTRRSAPRCWRWPLGTGRPRTSPPRPGGPRGGTRSRLAPTPGRGRPCAPAPAPQLPTGRDRGWAPPSRAWEGRWPRRESRTWPLPERHRTGSPPRRYPDPLPRRTPGGRRRSPGRRHPSRPPGSGRRPPLPGPSPRSDGSPPRRPRLALRWLRRWPPRTARPSRGGQPPVPPTVIRAIRSVGLPVVTATPWPSFPTRPRGAIKIARHGVDGLEDRPAVPDQVRPPDRRCDPPVLDQIALRDPEHEVPRGRVDLPPAEDLCVHAALRVTDDVVGVALPGLDERVSHPRDRQVRVGLPPAVCRGAPVVFSPP